MFDDDYVDSDIANRDRMKMKSKFQHKREKRVEKVLQKLVNLEQEENE